MALLQMVGLSCSNHIINWWDGWMNEKKHTFCVPRFFKGRKVFLHLCTGVGREVTFCLSSQAKCHRVRTLHSLVLYVLLLGDTVCLAMYGGTHYRERCFPTSSAWPVWRPSRITALVPCTPRHHYESIEEIWSQFTIFYLCCNLLYGGAKLYFRKGCIYSHSCCIAYS